MKGGGVVYSEKVYFRYFTVIEFKAIEKKSLIKLYCELK